MAPAAADQGATGGSEVSEHPVTHCHTGAQGPGTVLSRVSLSGSQPIHLDLRAFQGLGEVVSLQLLLRSTPEDLFPRLTGGISGTSHRLRGTGQLWTPDRPLKPRPTVKPRNEWKRFWSDVCHIVLLT